MTWAVDYNSPAPSAVCFRNPLFLHGFLLIYRPRKDERLSWRRWLTHSGQFSHKVVTCPTIRQAQDRESSPVKDQRSTTVLRRQIQTYSSNFWQAASSTLNVSVNHNLLTWLK